MSINLIDIKRMSLLSCSFVQSTILMVANLVTKILTISLNRRRHIPF